jgi:hypothetical protein
MCQVFNFNLMCRLDCPGNQAPVGDVLNAGQVILYYSFFTVQVQRLISTGKINLDIMQSGREQETFGQNDFKGQCKPLINLFQFLSHQTYALGKIPKVFSGRRLRYAITKFSIHLTVNMFSSIAQIKSGSRTVSETALLSGAYPRGSRGTRSPEFGERGRP